MLIFPCDKQTKSEIKDFLKHNKQYGWNEEVLLKEFWRLFLQQITLEEVLDENED